jgi:formate dehydrogenase major subunit
MTNGWIDIKNADMMLIMGANPAENHPCGFKWAIEAKLKRNAKMVVVDPRFTRTAATADLFLQIRAGTDIAFLGGLINYAIQNDRLAKEYLVNFTNAAFIVKEGFKLPEDGLFSGFDGQNNYATDTWNYEAAGSGGGGGSETPPEKSPSAAGGVMSSTTGGGHQAAGGPGAAGQGGPKPPPTMPENVAYDLTLQHERSVFQLLKKQYSRYTPEMVERITGIPKDQFTKAADLFTSVRKMAIRKKPRRSSTLSAGRNTRPAHKSFVRLRSCNCCSATSVAPAAASTPCVVTATSRARPTWVVYSTSSPAISRFRLRQTRISRPF